jgi:thioredoxin-like negative regulator of GroEL
MSYSTLSEYNESLSDTEVKKTHGFQRSNPSMHQPSMMSAELLYPEAPRPLHLDASASASASNSTSASDSDSASKENYASEFVKELTDKTISSVKDAPTLTMFYASWCSHCTHFRPIYEEASRLANDAKVNVQFTAIESSTYNSVVADFNVKGFPTVILFKDGNQIVYEGRRVSSDIVEWLSSK